MEMWGWTHCDSAVQSDDHEYLNTNGSQRVLYPPWLPLLRLFRSHGTAGLIRWTSRGRRRAVRPCLGRRLARWPRAVWGRVYRQPSTIRLIKPPSPHNGKAHATIASARCHRRPRRSLSRRTPICMLRVHRPLAPLDGPLCPAMMQPNCLTPPMQMRQPMAHHLPSCTAS